MALEVNDNFKVLAPKPADSRYLNNLVPYVSVAEANTNIPLQQRHIGLIVNIANGFYWYKNGISDLDLIQLTISDISTLQTILDNKANILTRFQALVIEADFYTTTSPYAQGLTGTAISSGTIAVSSGSNNHPGAIVLRDSTTANGGWRILTETTAILLAGGEKSVIVFSTSTNRITAQARLSFQDSTSVTLPTDGVYMEWLSSTNVIQGFTRNNNVQSATATSFSPTLNAWYTSVIELNSDATLVTFTLYNENGTVAWTDTLNTNIPVASGRSTGWGILTTESTTDAAADLVRVDYMRMEINRTLIR